MPGLAFLYVAFRVAIYEKLVICMLCSPSPFISTAVWSCLDPDHTSRGWTEVHPATETENVTQLVTIPPLQLLFPRDLQSDANEYEPRTKGSATRSKQFPQDAVMDRPGTIAPHVRVDPGLK